MRSLTKNEVKEVIGANKFIRVTISNRTMTSPNEEPVNLVEFSNKIPYEEQDEVYKQVLFEGLKYIYGNEKDKYIIQKRVEE